VFKPSRISQVFKLTTNYLFFIFVLAFSVGDVMVRACFATFWLSLPGPGRQPKKSFFWFTFFGILDYHPDLSTLEALNGLLA